MAPAGGLSRVVVRRCRSPGCRDKGHAERRSASGLRNELVHALEHAEADRPQAGNHALHDAHCIVEPLVSLVLGLEPHDDILSSDTLPFRVRAEYRPPLHEERDPCPVLRGYKTPGVGQHASIAPSSRVVRPLDGARKPGAIGASVPLPVTRSLFAAVGLYEREAALITELHVTDGFQPHVVPPWRNIPSGIIGALPADAVDRLKVEFASWRIREPDVEAIRACPPQEQTSSLRSKF